MRLKNRMIRFFVATLIAMAFTTQGIAPLTATVVKAAQEAKVPGAALKSKTLYVGYESYTVKINDLTSNAKVSYESGNKQIASVNTTGLVKPMKAGVTTITATISQNSKKYTSEITITVKNPYLIITDKIQEIMVGASHTFTCNSFGISGKKLAWTSSLTSVGTIDSATGEFKAISAGVTTINLKDSKTGAAASLVLTVTPSDSYIPPEGSDKAVYLSGLDLSKKSGTDYTTTKEEYIETTRFVLYLDKGIEVPVNVIELINHVMDTIEKETSYKFYVKRRNDYDYMGMDYELDRYFETAEELKKVNTTHERVEIVIANHDQAVEAYASGVSGILLAPEHIRLLDENDYVIVHELLHIAWQRNGKYMGSVLAEGFAEYYTTSILEKDEVLKSTYSAYNELKDYQNIINLDTIEDLFINYTAGSSRYQLGFRITCFIIEKYGAEAYRRVHEKATAHYDGFSEIPMEIVAEAIKSELSKNFFKEFVKWYTENLDRFGDKDMSIYGDWFIQDGTLNKYYGDDKAVIIPDTVTFINGEAFMDNRSIETVKIPDGVTVIASGVFFDCINLKEITIPEGVTDIGFNTFEGCTNLKKVVLPKSITRINIRTFMDCTSLTDIKLPVGMTSIEANAFTGCSALKTITLPNTLTSIGATAFSDCTSLESIVIPNSISYLPEHLFNGCTALKSVVLPENLSEICSGMFWDCTSLSEITLPKKITSIGHAAFDFAGLKSIEIPGMVTEIGDFAFANNKDLKSIIIPKSVMSIGNETFYGCNNITIYGASGSYAEKFAKEHKIKFSVMK